MMIVKCIKNNEVLKNFAEFNDINTKDKKFCVLVAEIDNYEEVCFSKSCQEQYMLLNEVINICRKLINNACTEFYFENNHGEYVFIICAGIKSDSHVFYNLAKNIRDELLRCMNLSITIGISSEYKSSVDVCSAYKEAITALGEKFFCGKNTVITSVSVKKRENKIPVFEPRFFNLLEKSLKAGDKSEIGRHIEKYFSDIGETYNKECCLCACQQLILFGNQFMSNLEIEEYMASEEINTLYKTETFKDMKLYVMSYYRKLSDLISKNQRKNEDKIVYHIKKIIKNRFAEELTISQIAEEVYLTPTYICSIFKQETGETILEYITNIRMEQAKAFLEDLSNKTGDVCGLVGYKSQSYFSRRFKKYTGMSPKKYRDKFR